MALKVTMLALHVVMTPEERDFIKRAANASRRGISMWMRQALRDAAERTLLGRKRRVR